MPFLVCPSLHQEPGGTDRAVIELAGERTGSGVSRTSASPVSMEAMITLDVLSKPTVSEPWKLTN